MKKKIYLVALLGLMTSGCFGQKFKTNSAYSHVDSEYYKKFQNELFTSIVSVISTKR